MDPSQPQTPADPPDLDPTLQATAESLLAAQPPDDPKSTLSHDDDLNSDCSPESSTATTLEPEIDPAPKSPSRSQALDQALTAARFARDPNLRRRHAGGKNATVISLSIAISLHAVALAAIWFIIAHTAPTPPTAQIVTGLGGAPGNPQLEDQLPKGALTPMTIDPNFFKDFQTPPPPVDPVELEKVSTTPRHPILEDWSDSLLSPLPWLGPEPDPQQDHPTFPTHTQQDKKSRANATPTQPNPIGQSDSSAVAKFASESPIPPGNNGDANAPGPPSPNATNRQPIYPRDAIQKGYQGVVTLAFDVSPQGHVQNLTLAKSSGHDSLDQSALAAYATWTFKPAQLDGHPVPYHSTTSVTFNLNNVN